MPSHNQNTVNIPEGGTGGMGGVNELSRSNTESLKASFPGSPIHDGTLTRENVQTQYQELAMDGEVLDGFCFPKFNRDYDKGADGEKPPAIADVETGGEGLPGSPHMPNPASPGVGSANASDQPDPPADMEKNKSSRPPFIGEGTDLDPATSSAKQSGLKLKDYILGKSTPTSVGSYNKSK